MNYLEKVNKEENVTLYINGDLIDRGPDSANMLLDVIERSKKGPFKIEYLGGSHELLMHQFFQDKKEKTKNYYEDWFDNGGMSTYYDLEEILGNDEKLSYVSNFISNLNVYHKFEEKINNKNIVLVHSASTIDINDECNLKVKDSNNKVLFATLSRSFPNYFPFGCKIGNPNYFTIVGHTPNNGLHGYEYNKKENYLNIDGGCSRYVSGDFSCDHVPLIEVNDGYLKILVFNNNNEIIYGSFFENDGFYKFSDIELDFNRKYLDSSLKVKKLIKNEDGAVYYNE